MGYKELFLYQEPLINYNLDEGEPKLNLLGAPFDNTSTYRAGSRFGPNALREAFANIEIFSPDYNLDLEKVSIRDWGNLRASKKVEEYISNLSKVIKELIDYKKSFGIFGGEHTITLGSIKALKEDVHYIIFDAHFDLRDEYEGFKISHATFLKRAIEELGENKFLHIGSRAMAKEEWEYAKRIGLNFITTKEIIGGKLSKLKEMIKPLNKIYVSVDLDVLDPCYAPGVSNPEPLGLSSFQFMELLNLFRTKRLVGFDIVELCPPYDNGNTALLAAKILSELLILAYKY
ncbi:MAG: agmatinase [Nitrososphaerales archaeon]